MSAGIVEREFQPGLAAALRARFPGVEFEVVWQENGVHTGRFQTITFRGPRHAVERFAPLATVLAKRHGYTDEFGDLWYAHEYPGNIFRGGVHSDCEGTEAPWRVRHWPLSGLSGRVETMIRRIARGHSQVRP